MIEELTTSIHQSREVPDVAILSLQNIRILSLVLEFCRIKYISNYSIYIHMHRGNYHVVVTYIIEVCVVRRKHIHSSRFSLRICRRRKSFRIVAQESSTKFLMGAHLMLSESHYVVIIYLINLVLSIRIQVTCFSICEIVRHHHPRRCLACQEPT